MNFNEIGLKDLVLDFDSNDLQDITIVQGDTKTRGFKVLVSTNNGEIIKASSNYEMRLYGVNSNYPDKSFFTKGTIDGDFYKVYISTDMASKSGKLQLQLALFEGTNALIQSRIKEVDVYNSIANGGNVGKDLVVDFTRLQEALDRVDVQEKKYDKSLVRQEAIESDVNKKHTEVVQIRDGLKNVFDTENARVEAEKKRASAENTRVSQEKTRQSYESTRQSQEKTRQTQEKQRVEAEKLRQSQEQSRVDAESKRATSEIARNQSEKARSTKETERQNTERIRQSNENTRQQQESSRVEAEKKRKNTFDTWDKTMKNVIESEHLHIAYADSEDGSVNFSKKEANRKFIGQYVDYEEKGSDDYTKYKWSLIKGDDGSNFTWNLLKNSNVRVENANYEIARYDLVEKPTVGETYTCTLWGNLAKEKGKFNLYNSSGSIPFGSLTKIKDGMYQKTFKWFNSVKLSDGSTFKADDTHLRIYALPNTVKGVTSTIDKIKLEKGVNNNPVWSPHVSEINGKDGVDGKDGTFEGEIGGRNLIKNSDDLSSCFYKFDGGNHKITDEEMKEFGFGGKRLVSEAGNQTDSSKEIMLLDSENLVDGKIYTFSMYVKNNRDVPMKFNVRAIEHNFIELKPNETKRLVVTGKRIEDKYANGKFRVFFNANTKDYYIDFTLSRPQLEEGDVATSWSKNHSDFQSDISNLQHTLDNKASDLSSLEAKVKNLSIDKISNKNGNGSLSFWTGTQSQYDRISSKDSNTIYFITE